MKQQQSIQVFGEVLFDCFPDQSCVLGGAPFNVAWHLQAFGAAPKFISRIGTDKAGSTILACMSEWGLETQGIQRDNIHPTGKVQVWFENNEPHYDIVADSAYDFIDATLFGEKANQGILYHGSLAIRQPVSKAALQQLKANHQGKIFVDINLRPPYWQKETVQSLLLDADWVKLNDAELMLLQPDEQNVQQAMQAFYKQFELETLVVTCGEQGAIAINQHGIISVTPAVNIELIDTVGAGDAFSSVLILGMIKNWSLKLALTRAQDFASAIVGQRGATANDWALYHSFCKSWNLNQ